MPQTASSSVSPSRVPMPRRLRFASPQRAVRLTNPLAQDTLLVGNGGRRSVLAARKRGVLQRLRAGQPGRRLKGGDMCCAKCPEYPCNSALTLRLHVSREGGMPENHYHFCRSDKPCDFRCPSCGKLEKKWAHLPHVQFLYGCCHRCPEFTTCTDFVARNVEQAKSLGLCGSGGPSKTQHAIKHSDQATRRAPRPRENG